MAQFKVQGYRKYTKDQYPRSHFRILIFNLKMVNLYAFLVRAVVGKVRFWNYWQAFKKRREVIFISTTKK